MKRRDTSLNSSSARNARFAIVLSCCLLFTLRAKTQTNGEMPKISGESFAGHKVELPNAATGTFAVLIFGFSKASKTPTTAWADRIYADYASQPGVAVYQLPVLEDVPHFIRGMVISSIRKGVPENRRDHFVPILKGEAELKKLVGYKEPDDDYLVVLDRSGKIANQTHGPFSDANYSRLHTVLDGALKSAE